MAPIVELVNVIRSTLSRKPSIAEEASMRGSVCWSRWLDIREHVALGITVARRGAAAARIMETRWASCACCNLQYGIKNIDDVQEEAFSTQCRAGKVPRDVCLASALFVPLYLRILDCHGLTFPRAPPAANRPGDWTTMNWYASKTCSQG